MCKGYPPIVGTLQAVTSQLTVASMQSSGVVMLLLLFSCVIGFTHGGLMYDHAGPPSTNLTCLTQHCLKQASACALKTDCRKAMECATKCMKMWDNDTTSEKYHVQNCTNICAFSYRVEAYDNFMACVSEHKCVSFPAIPSQCKAPEKLTVLKKVAIKDLAGSWWVVKGGHLVYDCYPCQHLLIKQLNSTTWSYTPKYEVYLANGSLGLVHDTFMWHIPDPTSGPELSFVYHDAGLVHYENWWLFDAADDLSYILMYYCGNTLQWYYDGALVLSKEKTLSAADYTKIAASYSKGIGLDTAKFCNTSTTNCPD